MEERGELKKELLNIKEPGLGGFENKTFYFPVPPDGRQF